MAVTSFKGCFSLIDIQREVAEGGIKKVGMEEGGIYGETANIGNAAWLLLPPSFLPLLFLCCEDVRRLPKQQEADLAVEKRMIYGIKLLSPSSSFPGGNGREMSKQPARVFPLLLPFFWQKQKERGEETDSPTLNRKS